MIKLTNVVKSYWVDAHLLHILHGISLEIHKGEFVAIMGHSGSGKSTLLNILGLLDVADEGDYELDGQSVRQYTANELADIRNRRFGFVFQLFNLIPRLSALRNVELPLLYAKVSPAERTQRAQAALQMVGLQNRCHHAPSQLSGGQQQLVAVARALVNNPEIIILDEPTGNLDVQTSHKIMTIFKQMHALGKTLILVTHEPDIATYAQRQLYLKDGRIEKEL